MRTLKLKLPWWVEENPNPNTIKGMSQMVTTVENDMVAAQVVGGTNTQREFNMGLEKKFLDTLYQMHQPGQEFQASYKKMAEETQIPANIVSNVIQFLEDSNLLTRRFEWPHEAGKVRSGGRQAYWTLMTGYDHAANLLSRFHNALAEGKVRRRDIKAKGNPWLNGKDNHGGRKPKAEQMELAPENPILLPGERPSEAAMRLASEVTTESNATPIETAKQLVENVRNYMNAQNLINHSLDALRASGIQINEEAYFASVSVKPDATAEAIALVMPYIDDLETRVSNYRRKR